MTSPDLSHLGDGDDSPIGDLERRFRRLEVAFATQQAMLGALRSSLLHSNGRRLFVEELACNRLTVRGGGVDKIVAEAHNDRAQITIYDRHGSESVCGGRVIIEASEENVEPVLGMLFMFDEDIIGGCQMAGPAETPWKALDL